MKTQFAILDPLSGGYVYVDTMEEVAAKMAEISVSFYMSQTAQTPLSIVQTSDTGTETWFTATGEKFPELNTVLGLSTLQLKNMQSMQDAAALDVTRLGE